MSKFDKKNNEMVPEDYFVKFGQRMMEQTMEEELFKPNDFPILSSIVKNEDFIIPDNYLTSVDAFKFQSKKKTVSIFRMTAIAASLLLAVTIFTLSDPKPAQKMADVGLEEENEIDLLNQELDILEYSDLDELHSLIDFETDVLNLEELDNDVLLNYLLDESDQFDLASVY